MVMLHARGLGAPLAMTDRGPALYAALRTARPKS
jgi:hypothetical protein